jgi:transposase
MRHKEEPAMEKYISYVGIDLGDRTSRFCVTDNDGKVVKEFCSKTTRDGLMEALKRWPCSRVALETGTHSLWAARALGQAGHSVVVADARKVALIHANVKKCDALDARTLARLLRLDVELLSPVHVRSEQSQGHLELLKARDTLVRVRATLINHVRGAVKSAGDRLVKCSAAAFAHRAKQQVPAGLQEALLPLLEQIETLTARIKGYDATIESVSSEHYPQTHLLRAVAGIGPITSLAFVLTIEEPGRFKRGRQVGAYLGLTPRRDQSGERDPQLRITKAGNGFLRRLLVSAAQYVLGPFGPDTALRRWGLAKAGGAKRSKRIAVVAVARKLAVLLHTLWVNGMLYEAFPDGEGAAQLPAVA